MCPLKGLRHGLEKISSLGISFERTCYILERLVVYVVLTGLQIYG